MVRYCTSACQKLAWRTRHKATCGQVSVPNSFSRVRSTLGLSITFDQYILLINAATEYGPRHTKLLEVAQAISSEYLTLIEETTKMFNALTNCRLPPRPPIPWAHIRAPDNMAWTRHPADNDDGIIDTFTFKRSGARQWIDIRRPSGAQLMLVNLSTCQHCAIFSSLVIIDNGKKCVLHDKRIVEALDVCRIDFVTKMDVFTTSEMLRYTNQNNPNLCACRRSVNQTDVLSASSSTVSVAVVRLTGVNGNIIDIVATVITREQGGGCAGTLTLKSHVLNISENI